MHCTYRKFRGQKTNLCEIIGWHLNFFVNLMKWIYKGQMLTACSTTLVASFLKTKFPWWPTFMYVQKCLNWRVPFSTRSKDAPGHGSGWGPPLQHCGLWTGDTAQQVEQWPQSTGGCLPGHNPSQRGRVTSILHRHTVQTVHIYHPGRQDIVLMCC